MRLNVKKRACLLSELGVRKKGGTDNSAQAEGCFGVPLGLRLHSGQTVILDKSLPYLLSVD